MLVVTLPMLRVAIMMISKVAAGALTISSRRDEHALVQAPGSRQNTEALGFCCN